MTKTSFFLYSVPLGNILLVLGAVSASQKLSNEGALQQPAASCGGAGDSFGTHMWLVALA
jgi:hypothetical protein